MWGDAMAVVTVANVEQVAGGATHISPVSASKTPAPPSLSVIIPSMAAVAVAIVGMWFAYKYAIKPTTIGVAKNYVPYAAVVAASAALERLLEPLSEVLMPTTAAKTTAAQSKTAAQADAANPQTTAAEVQPKVLQAASDQAVVDTLRNNRAVLFWAIASICGLGISGGFGLFLLQSIATGHVNSFLDLAVTGLTIGAGTKPTHDLITSLQAKASGSSS
jgi:hypothetical protein